MKKIFLTILMTLAPIASAQMAPQPQGQQQQQPCEPQQPGQPQDQNRCQPAQRQTPAPRGGTIAQPQQVQPAPQNVAPQPQGQYNPQPMPAPQPQRQMNQPAPAPRVAISQRVDVDVDGRLVLNNVRRQDAGTLRFSNPGRHSIVVVAHGAGLNGPRLASRTYQVGPGQGGVSLNFSFGNGFSIQLR